MEGGNGATNGSGITQFAEGEPKKYPLLSSPDGGAKPYWQKDKVMPPKTHFSAPPASNQEPTLSGVISFATLTTLPPFIQRAN